MIYELSCDGFTVGYFLTEAEAEQRAAYLPKARYMVREWTLERDFITFDPATN